MIALRPPAQPPLLAAARQPAIYCRPGACGRRRSATLRAIAATETAMSDDFFAAPPFNPDSARTTLVRALRELKLAERGGAFEFNGQPVVKAQVDGAVLKLDVARRPSRSPDWDHAQAADHAQLRRFIDDVKKRVARWAEGRDD
jgi:hypothetical protein